MTRPLAIAMATVMALPAISSAQHGRQFKNSWFWGIKGGGFAMADSGQAYTQAPLAGIDWLITRTHGGLYVSGGQSFFNQQTFPLRDRSAPLDSGFRVVDLKNLRKLDIAVMGFPGEHLRFHPYFGAGFALAQVAAATARGPFSNIDQLNDADAVIQDERVGFSPLFIAGGQYRMRRFSVFGQATASPAQKNFLLYNGRPFNFSYEVGLRYNVGSSIDR
jgi:opacity protein-like surface antigen